MGHGRTGKRIAFVSACAVALGTGASFATELSPPAVQPPPPSRDIFARAFVDEATVTAHFRSYYLERDNPTPPGLGAWAAGGWLGYQSGWLADFLRVGVVGYTSQPIWAPPERDGTLLLGGFQQPYSVVGQAYVALKVENQVFTGYRQLIDQLEVNPQDNRMTPNTFEAYGVAGGFGPFKYYAGYLDKMKTRNWDTFRDFATVAGAPLGVSSHLWLGTVQLDPIPEFTARAGTYHVPDILTSSYGDAVWRPTFTELLKARFGGQFMYQSSNGANLLTGAPFDTWSGGLRSELIFGPATFMVAYNQTNTSAAYRNPYGSWMGYNSMLVRDLNRAGERSLSAGFTFDFAGVAPGLSFTAAAAAGRNAINATTGAPLVDTNEYDFTLDYRFTANYWPEALRPLWIRARTAHIEDRLNGTLTETNDYRVIVNYEWVFKATP